MKKKYKDFIIMLGIFFLFLFRNSINEIMIILNKDFDFGNICSYRCVSEIKENEELKKIIDFSDTLTYDYIVTRIKYRDVLGFTDKLQIFKGSDSDIKEGLAVVNDLGLVGVIKTVDKATSMVELIGNKNSNISVRINDTYGILKFQDNHLIVSDITNYNVINKGDLIYTSGIGNLPGEIYIGQVSDVVMSDLGIEQTIYVDSAVDFNNLSYLVVIKP